ncbi:MAG: oligosaccharide flippase family protein [Sphingobacteriales bacterium]|nr:oligosaccharide flippase family protein [Sphingobacteriales bacterium]
MTEFEHQPNIDNQVKTQQGLYQSLVWRGGYYLSVFFLNLFIARHFEASISGHIYYLCSIYALVQLFISMSLDSGIIFFVARKEIAVGRLLNFSILWSAVCGVAIYFVIPVFYDESGMEHTLFRISAICFISGNLLLTYCTCIFYAKRNYSFPNLVTLVVNLVLILLIPGNIIAKWAGITDTNYFYLYFSSFLLTGILLSMAAQVKYVTLKFQGFLNGREIQILIRYCGLAFAANIIFFFLYRVDYWFVGRFCNASSLGNYIQVSKLGQLFFVIPTILASAIFPLVAGGQKDTVKRILPLMSRSILFLYLIICALLIISGKWLFPFLFGVGFSDMYLPFILLVPGILALSCLFTITAYYAGKDRIWINIKGSLLALLVIIAGDSIFIPRYGIAAAALVSSIGYIIYLLYILSVFVKEYAVPLSSFFMISVSDWASLKLIITKSK